jgi:cell division protein FtsQ
MAILKKYHFYQILAQVFWLLIATGTVTLLVAAITKKRNDKCSGIHIHISGVKSHYFIDQEDVINSLQSKNKGNIEHCALRDIDLAAMEKILQKNKWIQKAELFFDNNNILQVKIAEREPVARIFTTSGASFYIDSSILRLPLSEKFSPRLPVFTSFPTDVKVLTRKDSGLLEQIRDIGEIINGDAFWMAQIEQIDITPEREFEIIPKIGRQLILFGDGSRYREKFQKLLVYYKQVAPNVGWNTYAAINLKYKEQVVGVRRDAKEIKADSLRTVQIMKSIIANAQKSMNDTTTIQLVQPAESSNIINIPRHTEVIPEEQFEKSIPEEIKLERVEETLLPPDEFKEMVTDKKSAPKSTSTTVKQKEKNDSAAGGKKQPPKPRAIMPAQNDN